VRAELRKQVLPVLLKLYREDADAGIHGAVAWALRPDRQGMQLRPLLDWGEAKAIPAYDDDLKSRLREQRATTVAGQLGALAGGSAWQALTAPCWAQLPRTVPGAQGEDVNGPGPPPDGGGRTAAFPQGSAGHRARPAPERAVALAAHRPALRHRDQDGDRGTGPALPQGAPRAETAGGWRRRGGRRARPPFLVSG